MWRSVPNTSTNNRSNNRHTVYGWGTSREMNSEGYQDAPNTRYQSVSINEEEHLSRSGDDFIPLNVSTPVTQHNWHGGNWYSPRGGRNNTSGRRNFRNNYRSNYYSTPRLHSNTLYSSYNSPDKHFYRQRMDSHQNKLRFQRRACKQVNISNYIDMHSFLEDPWENLEKEFNDSKSTNKNETFKSESLSNPGLTNSSFTELSESISSRDTDLNDSQCSQDSKNGSSVNTNLKIEESDLSCTDQSSVKD